MKKRFQSFIGFIKRRKWAIAGLLLLLLVALLVIRPRLVSYLNGPAEKYETAEVKRESLEKTISAAGEVVAKDQAVVKFQTSGKLVWVGVEEGDFVKQGQALASLDKQELEKTLKQELNDYMGERWDFAQDRDDYDITSDDLDSYTVTNEVRRILDKAQFDLNNSVIDVEIAKLAVDLATIYSPIAGIVTKIESPVAGVNITAATAGITIANPSVMKFVASIDETDIAGVRAGQKVTVFLDAYLEEEFEGEIDQVAFAAVTTRGGGTAFPIEIYLPSNLDERFKVGMNGDAEVVLDSRQNTLAIPIEAVKTKDGQTYVQAIEGKKVADLTVKTGLESETSVEILEGLKEGQEIITGEKKKTKK